jgi:hypothetical protein
VCRKGLILEAVTENPGEGAAGKISALKKDAMANVPGICAPARVSVALLRGFGKVNDKSRIM